MTVHNDVIIIGGGLAGFSLAMQLHQANNSLNIAVIEKNTFPVPETTAKVGESTVEIGSHYLTEVLGLKPHFDERHLRKHGLRCFFGKPTENYAMQDELGVSQLFGIPTYQIERGALENHLFEQLQKRGVTILDGAEPYDIQLANKQQAVTVKQGEQILDLQAPWIVDAAGRQALLKNKLDLHKPSGHKSNAIFFRIDKTIVIDDWTSDEQWQNRIECSGKRWLSTNHLMGPGYWVWIIPLGSGATSIGIVIDDQALQESQIKNYEDTIAWLEKEQPKCAEAIAGSTLLDFHIIRDYSYACTQVFSHEGWALTGEAGMFADPFYSPGSDFIAIGNTFITKLIEKDFQKQDIHIDSIVFNKLYHSFFENTLSIYNGLYGGFGDRKMMSIKLVWDYTYYWGVLTLLFFKGAITDITLMQTINPELILAQKLNKKMQALLVERSKQRRVLPAKGLFMDQYLVPCLKHFNDVLKNAEDIELAQALKDNINIMQDVAHHLEDMLSDDANTEISDKERAVLGEYRMSVVA